MPESYHQYVVTNRRLRHSHIISDLFSRIGFKIRLFELSPNSHHDIYRNKTLYLNEDIAIYPRNPFENFIGIHLTRLYTV